jgi:D-xylose transport system substrate-binding protein
MKSKFLVFSFLILFAGFLIMQACDPAKKTPVIGLLMDQFNVERWAKDTAFFIKAVEQLNGKVICLVANGDAQKQMEQAKMLIDKGVKVLVIVPVDVNKSSEIIKSAHLAARNVISYDRLIQNAPVDYYISFDNVKVGELQANYIRQRLAKGNIAIIGGPPSDQNSFYLRYGQLGVLQPYIERGEIKVVFDRKVKNWSFEEGYRLAEECLKNNKVDAIIAGNDLLASAVIKALKDKGLTGKVLVAGQDADSLACENILNGSQTISIYKPIENLASNAAQMAMDLAKGKQITTTSTLDNGVKMVPSLLLNPTLVNQSNIGMEIKTVVPK